jgi:hypothetical protein
MSLVIRSIFPLTNDYFLKMREKRVTLKPMKGAVTRASLFVMVPRF